MLEDLADVPVLVKIRQGSRQSVVLRDPCITFNDLGPVAAKLDFQSLLTTVWFLTAYLMTNYVGRCGSNG